MSNRTLTLVNQSRPPFDHQRQVPMPFAASVNGHAQVVVVLLDTGLAHPVLDLPASRARDGDIDPGLPRSCETGRVTLDNSNRPTRSRT